MTVNKKLCLITVFSVLITAGLFYFVQSESTVDNATVSDYDYSDDKDLQGLIQRVRNNPNDIESWNQIGRLFLLKKDYEKSYQAYSEAKQIDYMAWTIDKTNQNSITSSSDVNIERLKWITGLAEAKSLAQNGFVDEESAEWFAYALNIDENHPKALWYSGLQAVQQNNFLAAEQYWKKLKAQNPPDALGSVLDQRLLQLAELIQSSDITQEATINLEEKAAWQYKLRLVLESELESTVSDKTTVFIALRKPGIQVPLIVRKVLANEMRQTITISEKDTMQTGSNNNLDWNQLWEQGLELHIIYSGQGNLNEKDNIRFASLLNRDNLNGVNQFVLDPKLALVKE